MNTSKIFDVVPQATPAPAQPAITPPRSPQAVPPPSDGAASDALRKHAERQAEAAAAEAERKHKASRAEPRPHAFNREVGRVGDTFEVFVDLVSPALKGHRFRIFGPPDNPAPPPPVPTSDPAGAHAAYAGSEPTPPVLKTDV